jgi:hypothetical protein
VSQCETFHKAGHGQFSHPFSSEVYDFYSVSQEYFGYTLICYNHSWPDRTYIGKNDADSGGCDDENNNTIMNTNFKLKFSKEVNLHVVVF